MITVPRPKPKSILRKRRIKRQPINRPNTPIKPTETVNKNPIPEGETSRQRNNLTFAAPIKIIIIDPKSQYCKSVWCAVGIVLANMAIGGVVMSTLHYSVVKNDAHAVVCSIAYHIFTAQAILAFHYVNGWSGPMRTRHRKFAHFFLQICAIICAIVGTAIELSRVGLNDKTFSNPHGLTGVLAGMILILNAIIGPIAFYRRKACILTFHRTLGIVTFIMSSLCVCFGLALKPFKSWAGITVVYILIGFVVYYSVFIVTSSFMKCVSRL